MIKILYFGMIAEAMGKNEDNIELTFNKIVDLKQHLISENSKLLSYSFKFAVNNKLIDDDYILNLGDEIAVLPPFAGG